MNRKTKRRGADLAERFSSTFEGSKLASVAGKRIFEGRDKEPERASKVQERRCGDRISLSNPPIQGLFDENREISVRPRVCGGAERTRTACQARSRYRTGLSRVIRRGNSAIKCR